MANHVKARRKQLKLTQQAVAEAAGTTKATVMKLEKGDMQLTEAWLIRLATPLKCQPEDLIAQYWPREIPLIGEIYGENKVRLYRTLPANGMLDLPSEYWQGMENTERYHADLESLHDAYALRVIDDALEPLLAAGTLIYFSEIISDKFDAYLNQLVVCETEEREIYLSRLRRGASSDNYQLPKSLNAEVSLTWCARVVCLKP